MWAVYHLGPQHSWYRGVRAVLGNKALEAKPTLSFAPNPAAADLEHVQMGCDLAQQDHILHVRWVRGQPAGVAARAAASSRTAR